MAVPKGTRIGGRQKGTPNKRTLEIVRQAEELAARAVAEGKTPLEIMLENARHFHALATDAEATLAEMTIADLGAEGLSPDEQFKLLLAEVKKTAGFRQLAQEAARDAAPYMHARLNSIEAKITHRDEMSADELRRAIARDLAAAGVEGAALADTDGAGAPGKAGRLN